MLLNGVAIGKGYNMKVDTTALTQPHVGYDSVSVQVSDGHLVGG